jgi:hypothetical protein
MLPSLFGYSKRPIDGGAVVEIFGALIHRFRHPTGLHTAAQRHAAVTGKPADLAGRYSR